MLKKIQNCLILKKFFDALGELHECMINHLEFISNKFNTLSQLITQLSSMTTEDETVDLIKSLQHLNSRISNLKVKMLYFVIQIDIGQIFNQHIEIRDLIITCEEELKTFYYKLN